MSPISALRPLQALHTLPKTRFAVALSLGLAACGGGRGTDGAPPDDAAPAAPAVTAPDAGASPPTLDSATATPSDASADTDLPPDGAAAPEVGAPDAAVPTPTPKQRVLDYVASLSGHATMSGIHNRHNATPSEFTAQMHDLTGKYPAFWSGDFLFEPTDLAHRQTMIDQAKLEWSHGAVVQVMFHACPPDLGEPCNWNGGLLDHALSDAAWKDLTTDGGALNAAWKARLDVVAGFLQQLKSAGVAPLFRPLHEMNQAAFWWGGRPGAAGTRRLFQLTHDYLVKTKGLDNLIWVWDVQDLSWDFDQYDPGEAYYDLAALDVYGGDGFTKAKYDAMVKVSPHRPIAIGECQQLPSPSELSAQPRWTFFMGWSELVAENNSTGAIQALFDATNVRTLDEMPGWH
jgi:mannan endo-1,4-beta-mannosidase